MQRRAFLKQVSGTGLATGSLLPGRLGASGRQGSMQGLAEIGMVVAHGCHAQAVWADTMNPAPGKMRTNGMVITKVWSFRPDFAARFAERFPGVEAVGNLEDLVGTVDGVYIDAMPAVSLYHLLARPFLLAGMPTFVNRPFSSSVEKARLIIEAARQGQAPLMSNSTWGIRRERGGLAGQGVPDAPYPGLRGSQFDERLLHPRRPRDLLHRRRVAGGTEKGPGEVSSGLLSDARLAETARGAEFRP